MSTKMPVRALLRRKLPPDVYGGLRTVKGSPVRAFQWAMDQCGFVVARKSDYYSPLPSRRRLQSTRERWDRPSALLGVEYDLAGMKGTLAELLALYQKEFLELMPYEEALQLGFGPGFPRLDAMVLYAMLRLKKPKRYVEVGSGLSTYYASLAAERNAREGSPMRITCVEPYPFEALWEIPEVRVVQQEVQDVGTELFTSLGRNDVLFIDSSHIVRLDGDVPFLFLEVLPAMAPGTVIHVHDIPFPYHGPYPAEYWIYESVWPMWWNESMLLHALLCGNGQFAVTLSAPLIRHHDEEFLRRVVSDYRGVDEEPNTFSSIWIEKI
ncbi:class I SAM-dependent methyltransferase [Tunturiibacter gelidiferens]|uniref:class I SAM-dependent methyltransferase n=1 Tax=Tunturiibacter gelidiferens TaxID=3069689 RepID=UPI003D9ADDF2